MQSVVQQAQQHMFQQLEQCMQQAYTGLTLGTPVRAKEYSEQFKKNNNTLVLTETKQIDLDNHPSQWEDNEDSASGMHNHHPPHSHQVPIQNLLLLKIYDHLLAVLEGQDIKLNYLLEQFALQQ